MLRASRLLTLCVVLGMASSASAFGPKAHRLVGAVADELLKGKPEAAKIKEWLDGVDLARAATLADDIKSWDDDSPSDPDSFHLPEHPKVEEELLRFYTANRGQGAPSHGWFHYTDIPTTGTSKYGDGKVGRGKYDIVQMIPFCVKVLQGTEPESNERKITKPIAVILLSHYVGDFHQPLHIGAPFFNSEGQLFNPDEHPGEPYFENQGGNSFLLLLRQNNGDLSLAQDKLHGYWDTVATRYGTRNLREQIRASLPDSLRDRFITDAEVAKYLADKEPEGWKVPADLPVQDWALAWTEDVMPMAREAMDRLEFKHIEFNKAKKLATGQAIEKARDDGDAYRDYSARVSAIQMHRAGWRLAAILEAAIE